MDSQYFFVRVKKIMILTTKVPETVPLDDKKTGKSSVNTRQTAAHMKTRRNVEKQRFRAPAKESKIGADLRKCQQTFEFLNKKIKLMHF